MRKAVEHEFETIAEAMIGEVDTVECSPAERLAGLDLIRDAIKGHVESLRDESNEEDEDDE